VRRDLQSRGRALLHRTRSQIHWSRHDLPAVRTVTLPHPDLPPAWDGVTIAQVSDVHAAPHMSRSRMGRIRNLVNALGADLVVFTGDQVDRRLEDAERFASGFAGLRAPLGAYGILGNHDHYVDPETSENALREAGITPLVNRSVELDRHGSRLAVIGLEDLNATDGRKPDFDLIRSHPGAFRLCLCHQPRGWSQAHAAGAHVTLSGHTHGGQIVLTPRTLNVARLHSRYVAGPYRREDAFLYVSRGVGVGSVRIRVGAPPEVDLITLRRAEYAQLAAA